MMKKIVGCVGLIMSLALASQAVTRTWTNGVNDATGSWSNPGNWTNNAVPASGDSLVFGPTTGTTTLTNELTLTSLGAFTFNADAPAYTIYGINMNTSIGGFVLNSANNITQTININFTANQNALNVSGAGNLNFNGTLTKGGTWNPYLAMNGTGVLTIGGSGQFNTAGGTSASQINSGTLVLARTYASGGFNVGLTINGGTVKLGAAEQLRSGFALPINSGTLDLNGFDSAQGGNGAMVASSGGTPTGGSSQLTGLGGRIINNAAGTGTNWFIINGANNAASYGGTITDGATAKVGVSVFQNYNQWNYQAFSGNNTYSGGTFIQHGYTGSGGRPVTLSIANVASIGSTGNRNLTFKSAASSADTVLQLTGTAVTNSSQFNGITLTSGLGAGFDIADPNNTFTLGKNAGGTDITMTGTGVFEKLGAGTLVVTSGGLASMSGIYFGGGTLKIDAQSGGTLATQVLTFSGGNLYLLGKTSGTTTQVFNSVVLAGLNNYGTASGGAGMITVDANGGAGTTLTLGGMPTTTTAGYSLNIKTKTGGTVTTTTTTTINGLIGTGRILFTDASDVVDFASIPGSGTRYIQAATYTSGLPTSGSTSTANYSQADNASVTASESVNALKLTTSTTGQALTIDPGQTLTLTSGGLLFVGANDYTISGGTLKSATATASDLIIHQYGAGKLTISSGITNGLGASTLTKAGTGTLVLSGINTYSGATYVNGGILSISSDSNIAGANGTFGNLTSLTTSPTVNSTEAALPPGFGVGSTMLGRTVNTITGTSGAYVITLNGNANTALVAGTASWAHAPTLYLYSGGVLQANGNITLQESNAGGTTPVTTVNRGVTIGNSGGGFEVLTGYTLTNSGAITANGRLTKSGDGVMVSTVANTLYGGVTVNKGTLRFTVANNTMFGGLTLNGGTLEFSAANNVLSGGVTINGGTLLLSNSGNTFYGDVTLKGGTLQLNAANSIGGDVTLSNGGTLSLNSNSYVGSAPLIFAGGTLQVTGAQPDPSGLNIDWANFSGGFDITNAATTFTVTNAISGTGSLVKSGSGTLVLSGSNTYSGVTIISNGVLSCQYVGVTELDHYSSRVCTNLVNGTGMTPNTPVRMSSTCTNAQVTMWLSAKYSTNTWVTFDFGSVQTLTGFHLWNFNEGGANMANRGIKTAGIYTNSTGLASGSLYSAAGPNWGGLVTNMSFAKASGLNSYAGSDYMFSSPVSTRYVQIYVTTNWGDAEYTGLSEIRFYYGNTNTVLANTAVSIVSGATLDMGNGSMTVKDLAGSGTIANFASGTTLTVTGTNTFTGTISGSGELNVSGVISPAGRNVFGTNTVTQALTFSGTLEVDVATDGTSDQLVTQGALDLNGATVSVVNPAGLNKYKPYVVLTYSTAPTGMFSDLSLPPGWKAINDTANNRILLRAYPGTMVSFF
jgi:autotransporter-associated beta strand protein